MLRFLDRVLAACFCLLAANALYAQEGAWDRFRGPNGSGVAEVGPLPSEFTADDATWAVEVPWGHSSPVLGDTHLFLTGRDGATLSVIAVDPATGEVAWRSDFAAARELDIYDIGDATAPTPVTDGTNVYALFGNLGAVALDGEGNEMWRVELGPFANFYGTAASPILVGDVLVLVFDQSAGSFMLGLDKSTGEELWRRARPGRPEAWATPILYPGPDRPEQLLVAGSGWLDSYSFQTGEPFWELSGVGPLPVASPVLHDGMVITAAPDQAEYLPLNYDQLVSSGDLNEDGEIDHAELLTIGGMEGWGEHFGYLDIDGSGRIGRAEYDEIVGLVNSEAGVAAVRLSPDGTAPTPGSPEIAWREERAVPYMVSPIVYDGLLYTATDAGIITALDMATGEIVKRGRLSRSGANLASSPVGSDGKLYFTTRDGEVYVVRAGADWEVVAVNDLGESMTATPALSPGRLFIRTAQRLYAFSVPEE